MHILRYVCVYINMCKRTFFLPSDYMRECVCVCVRVRVCVSRYVCMRIFLVYMYINI